MRHFISWYQSTGDVRPLTFPPNEQILGWWKTGERYDDVAVLVARVEADSLENAYSAILRDWPEATEEPWRISDEMQPHHVLSDRFPLADWMKERLG